jgi:Family of unknown function (DUF5843)
MRVDLNAGEMHVCRLIGFLRRSINLNKTKDQQVGKQDPWDIDMDGVIGEFCVAKVLNVCPDFSIHARSGGDDLILPNGKSIDVKTTRLKQGNLLATLSKVSSQSDVYILAIVDDRGCDVEGWVSKEQLFKNENVKNLGHGNTYFLSKEQLNKDLEDLKND